MSDFKYAMNTNCLRNKLSIPEIVQIAKNADLAGIEWGLPAIDKVAADIKQMKSVTDDCGLDIPAYINAGSLWRHDIIKPYSEAVASVGGKMLRVAPPWIAWSYAESLHQKDTCLELLKKCRQGMEKLVEFGKSYGIKYVVEMHMGNVCPTAEAARSIVDGLDSRYVGIIYDPANGVFDGFTRPRYAMEVLGPYCAYIHAKNSIINYIGDQIDSPRRAAWDLKFCSPESGIVDFVEVYFAMKTTGYRGWISMEEFFGKSPETELVRAVAFLNECDKAASSSPQPPFTEFNK